MTSDDFSGDGPITSVSARAQSGRRRRRILVFSDHIDHVSGGYEQQLRAAFDASCRRHDFDLVIVVGRALKHPEPSHEVLNEVYELLDRDSADGVIFLSAALAAYSGADSVTRFRERFGSLSVCSVGGEVAGIPSIVVDNRPGMRKLMDHVIRVHGRRRVGFISGTPKNPDAEARLETYRAALAEHGIAFDPRLVATGWFHTASGGKAVEELLGRGVPFDALVVSNDAMALNAIETLKARGVRVPRDVAVTGFDDLVLARLASPPLTTVRQPLERMGLLAVELIRRQLDGETVPLRNDLPVEFVTRESCGCRLATAPRSPSLPEMPAAPSEPVPERRRLAQRMASDALEPEGERAAWVTRLLEGLEAELATGAGAFLAALEELLDECGDAYEGFEKLQRAVIGLADEISSPKLEPLWLTAHRSIESTMARALARQKLASDAVLQKLQRFGERLSTASLDWEELERVMAEELREIGLQNACVALFSERTRRELRPFVWIKHGVVQKVLTDPFESRDLLPPEACDERRTWFALPLTFEAELLGVASFEVGPSVVMHEMLRGQVSAALKSAALHREIVRTTELHVKSVQERIATSNRMASLSVLAGGVAHDLNNALGPLVTLPDVILAELEDLKRGELSDDQELRADVITIKSSALRAAQTIKDLMLLGRPGASGKESHDLNDIVASFAAADPLRLPGQRGPSVPLTIDLAGDMLAVTVSEPHVVRALTNLVRNAAEAMAEAGPITIRTRAIVLDEPLLLHETIPAGKYATVSVMDRGQGITEADLARIFEPFYSTKRLVEHSGSGLGLAIVHSVVKEHGGYLDVESKLGRGTTFTLYFPCAVEPNEPSGVMNAPPRSKHRILVIEDEPSERHRVGRALQSAGYSADTLGSAREALELYARLQAEASRSVGGSAPAANTPAKPPYELVVLDASMHEEQGGLETARNLQELYPDQRVVVVSGRPAIGGPGALITWLTKPYSPHELAGAVDRALELADDPKNGNLGVG
jgi:DNA-binding LacI/PurR family transcriptional regulator/signal transduction histidine kinase